MRKIIVLFLLLSLGAQAQDKLLTIQEAVFKGRTDLAPKRLQNLSFIPGSNFFFYVDSNKVWRGDNNNAKTKVLFGIAELNKALKIARRDTLAAIPTLEFKDVTTCSFVQDSSRVSFDVVADTLSWKRVNPALKEENADEQEKTKNVAFTRDNNLWVNVNGVNKQLTSDGSFNIVYGKSVHREEFGIVKGTFWSPNGNLLAFYRMDQTDVSNYPIINWKTYPAKNEDIKYPMAGTKSHYVTVGVYDIAKQTITYLKTPEPKEHYLTNIAWSPDEKFIYLAELNRGQNDMLLNEYSAVTGEFTHTLFEEKDEKYVEPLHPILFVPNHPNQFVWQSRKDGFNHIYLYDISGKELKQLTKDNWEVKKVDGFDAKGEKLFFHANSKSPVDQDFYSVTLKSGEVKCLTSGDGFHTCMLDKTGAFFIDNFSAVNIPREYYVVNTASDKSFTIFKAVNPIKVYKTGKWSLFTIKNYTGIDLYCRLFKPVDFDSTKKYPVLVYLYNGPHSQMVTNTWMAGGELWYQYMAEKGFIVFTMDGRGTSWRGKAFEQCIFRQLGTCEMEDQLKGVDYLKSLPYVDADRIGIHGWSFGGFMTISLMTRNPGVYKVAVAGGPVIDWSYYEVMYGERYMDMPQENKEGYDKNNLLNYVDKLKGKLLLINGAQDDVVVWQHSMMYLKAAVDKGIQLDYFVYPGHEHNVLGKDRAHLMEKVCNYFIDNL